MKDYNRQTHQFAHNLSGSVALQYAQLNNSRLIALCQSADCTECGAFIRQHVITDFNTFCDDATRWKKQAVSTLQEIFAGMWRGFSSLRNPDVFTRWVCQIVTHLFYYKLRRHQWQSKTNPINKTQLDAGIDNLAGYTTYCADTSEQLIARTSRIVTLKSTMTKLPKPLKQPNDGVPGLAA